MSGDFNCDEKTFRKWVWFFIEELSYTVGEVVSYSDAYSSYRFFAVLFVANFSLYLPRLFGRISMLMI